MGQVDQFRLKVPFILYLFTILVLLWFGSQAVCTPEWDASSLQGPMWAVVRLLPCSRVSWQCSEGAVAPSPTTRTHVLSSLGLWTKLPAPSNVSSCSLLYCSYIGISSQLYYVRVPDREPSGCWRAQSADGAARAGVYGRSDASNAGGARIHSACLPPLKC